LKKKAATKHEQGIQGDFTALKSSVGSLYEVDDGDAGAGGDDAGGDPEWRVLDEGSQKKVREWADKYKVIQKTYLDMVEDHFKKFEDILELKM
jgi:hypothetical protein